MEVVVTNSPEQLARLGADAVLEAMGRRARPTLGLATGSSPRGIYAELGRRVRAGEASLARVRAFLLDEYVGLGEDHPQRYRNVIARDLLDHVDIDPGRVRGPDGLADDVEAECVAFEQAIARAGGIDLQILGIGSDGHIAFNEPGSSLASRTRIKTLTRQTRQDNARFFGDDVEAVPVHCLTQGIATVMAAGHLLLVATGRAKAEAVHQLVEGPISAMWPATALQWHPHVTVLVDEAACARLQLAPYFVDTFEHKPDWQGF